MTRSVATGAQTRGDFGLFEVTMAPGGSGAGPHLHRTFSESCHVLAGSPAVLANGEIDAFALRHDQLNVRDCLMPDGHLGPHQPAAGAVPGTDGAVSRRGDLTG